MWNGKNRMLSRETVPLLARLSSPGCDERERMGGAALSPSARERTPPQFPGSGATTVIQLRQIPCPFQNVAFEAALSVPPLFDVVTQPLLCLFSSIIIVQAGYMFLSAFAKNLY